MSNDRNALSVAELREQCSTELSGSLTLTSGNQEILVNAIDSKIVVNLPDNLAVRLAGLSMAFKIHRQSISSMHQIFVASGVGVSIVLRGRTVATLGDGSRPGFVSKILKIEPFAIRLLPAISSLLSCKARSVEERITKKD
ncbi:hypothetical protein BH11CYA1_BH11CYA1_49330 [soil metagenome]